MNTQNINTAAPESTERFTWDADAELAYWLAQEGKYIKAPVEITMGAYHEAAGRYLEINWMYCVDAQTDSESFMSAEMVCGNVTDIYVRLGKRYFHLRDRESCTHEYLLKRIKGVLAKKTIIQM